MSAICVYCHEQAENFEWHLQGRCLVDLNVTTEGDNETRVIDAEGETVADCPTKEMAEMVARAVNNYLG